MPVPCVDGPERNPRSQWKWLAAKGRPGSRIFSVASDSLPPEEVRPVDGAASHQRCQCVAEFGLVSEHRNVMERVP